MFCLLLQNLFLFSSQCLQFIPVHFIKENSHFLHWIMVSLCPNHVCIVCIWTLFHSVDLLVFSVPISILLNDCSFMINLYSWKCKSLIFVLPQYFVDYSLPSIFSRKLWNQLVNFLHQPVGIWGEPRVYFIAFIDQLEKKFYFKNIWYSNL